MVTVHFNLHDRSDTGSMVGPTVTVTSGSDGMSVEVGQEFGRTAMTPEEWAELAAQRGDKPYVLVDTAPGRKTFVSPLRNYADAMAEFDREMTPRMQDAYAPHTGRHLMVMSQADYLARRDGGEQW